MNNFMSIVMICLLASPTLCRAQVGGNVGYAQGGGRTRAEQNERSKRVLSKEEMPPTGTSMFVEANVLMNVRADQFVAVFGVVQEGETIAECSRKMDGAIKQFTDEVKRLGIGGDDLFVDFIAENRTYGFEVAGNIAREKLVGFELKKNVSIHYRDRSLLDKLVIAASKSQIFDLIKVDYLVNDTSRIDDRLMEEASRVIKHKASRYERLLGVKLQPPAQVYVERPAMYAPTGMYDSYTAFETEQVGGPPGRPGLSTQTARKSRTFYYNALDASGFDAVINPLILEPVVQFTLYLKVKYEVAPVSAK